jgi:hypothetical protein
MTGKDIAVWTQSISCAITLLTLCVANRTHKLSFIYFLKCLCIFLNLSVDCIFLLRHFALHEYILIPDYTPV